MSSPAQMIAHEGFPCALQQGYRQGFEQGKLAGKKELLNHLKRQVKDVSFYVLKNAHLPKKKTETKRKNLLDWLNANEKMLKSQLKEEAKK